ncbi:hypothetical protein Tco_1012987, partial [Tanacetum coccineum]
GLYTKDAWNGMQQLLGMKLELVLVTELNAARQKVSAARSDLQLADDDVEGEGSGQPTEPQHTPTTASPSHVEPIPAVTSSYQPKKTHKHRKTIRKATEISQSSGPTTLVADETIYKERGDSVERAATTATSLDVEQGSGNINRTQSTSIPNDPFPQGTSLGGSPRCQDTILGDRPAQTRFERLFKQSNDPPLSRVNTLGSREDSMKLNDLMEIFKKLEKNTKSRTSQLKRRLFKVRIESSVEKSLEDAETQGRYGYDTEINIASTSITTASINITTAEPIITSSALVATASVSVSTAEPSTPPTTTTTFIEDEDLIIAQTLMKMRSVKSKEKRVSSETATRLTRGVIIKEASETATRPIVPPQQQLDLKDKGKGIMQEPEKPVKVKGKDQIKYDVDVAQRLQAELDEKIDADAQLAKRLQAKEREKMSVKERARLLMEFIAARKKFFTTKRAEEQRNKPPTKAEQRKKMCIYMKHMAGYKDKNFKGKSFDVIKQMFDKAYKQVNDFVPMDTESSRKKAVSKKRAGERPSKESTKRQKIKDDPEKAELKACLEIVPSDDSAVNIESLATKYPIVD